MKISLVYLTYRPGGLDLLADSLQHQDPSLYELVIVDDWPGRVERNLMKTGFGSRGVSIAWHGEPKTPSSEFRRKARAKGIANAYNTGALHCSTEFVVFVQDYEWLPPGAIEAWAAIADSCVQKKELVHGFAYVHWTKPPMDNDDWTIWPMHPPLDCFKMVQHEWVPEKFENFYFGCPMDLLRKSNGFDERVDLGRSEWIYPSTVCMAELNGYSLRVDKRFWLLMADHRDWPDDGQGLWHASKQPKATLEEPLWQSLSPNDWKFDDELERIRNA